ncbi:unnamed protein product [Effrenium voratum]|uniref:Uncharacterized protein n=1 Tax=Effrenium voratum TaxID=2562239 RepID=A0AA36IFL8_9DINO|nr:unnamed protein product [Effrenium voratum]
MVRLASLVSLHLALLGLLRQPSTRSPGLLCALDRLAFGVFILSPSLLRILLLSWHASCLEFTYYALLSHTLGSLLLCLVAATLLHAFVQEPWQQALQRLLRDQEAAMSSVYGPELLKDPTVADDVDVSLGRKKTGEEFETDHDRAKRIRRERRAAKEKEKEEQQKHDMNKAISALLGGGTSKKLDISGATFQSFGPGPAGPSGPGPSGPAAGPSAGPSGPGPSGPPGPAGPGEASPDPPQEASAAKPAGPSRPKVPQGPARPKVEEMPEQEKPEEKPQEKKEVRLGHMDIMKEQKRVSWDELKTRLAETNIKEAGVPGSNEFDDYAAKLEKTRNERLAQQEDDTKRALKVVNKSKKEKKEKKKDKKSGLKRTADGAVLAQSSGDSESEQDDALLSRYKKSK